MSLFRSTVSRLYAIGTACTFSGAWLTGETGSMLPLALGASAALVCGAPLVVALWQRARLPRRR